MTQITEMAKINRSMINCVLQLLHVRIFELAERESCFSAGEIEVDELYSGIKRVRGGGVGGSTKFWY
ncbi:MAG: hypothetical protein IJ730_00970 [Alphaproteobacteria bacterium]|nr:hypothetical protein [Alphaproteobacteria bacterium]